MLNKVKNRRILNWYTYIIPHRYIRPTPVWLLKGSAKIDVLAEALKAARSWEYRQSEATVGAELHR